MGDEVGPFSALNWRPLIRGKFGLRHGKIEWTDTGLPGMNVGAIEKIIEELAKQIGN